MNSPALEVQHLTFHYPDGRMALRDLSFAVAAGENVALVGPNGAGKSTLLLHLNGILPGHAQYEHHHHHGRGHRHKHAAEPAVWVDGLAVVDHHLPEVRRRVGLLFQNPDDQLFCPTVIEDVAFGPANRGHSAAQSQEIARRALDSVGMALYSNHLPHHLSLGERKRVCMAGILACEPTVLALDEPTGSLDPRGRRQFMALLRQLPGAKIIASHDLEMVLELCSRTILLDEGRLCADGPTHEVLADEPLLNRHGLELPLSLRSALAD